VPWFLDRRQSIGLRAFDQDLNYQGFDTRERYERRSRGGILTYGRSFRLFQSVSMSYNRSKYDDRSQVVTEDGTIVVLPLSLDNSSLRPVYLFDSRDNPFEPTRGRRLSLSAEYAGGFLGGDNYFIRPEMAFSIFQPVSDFPTRTVLALNLEAGLVDPFGGKRLSPLDRFFLGGENSIRGFSFRAISVRNADGTPRRDPITGSETVGGDKFFQTNLEYHFLLGGPFRVLMFADAGNVYAEDQSFDLSNLRYSAGAELRVLVPVFGAPLRFIYAINLDPLPGDRFQDFQFSIGTSF
jgi:outer membrane protein insertion porin family